MIRNERAPGTLQAVDRSLRLLTLLADSPRPRTLQQLSALVGCSPSTAHRMLASLARYQLVEKDPQTRRYRLGLGVLRLAEVRASQIDLRELARPHMEELRDRCLETLSLYVVHGLDAVCIDRIDSPQEIRRTVEVGKPVPLAELGATAKVFLAYLPETAQSAVLERVQWQRLGRTRSDLEMELARIRQAGAAWSIGERIPGAASLAAAIYDDRGRATAAISISGPASRWTEHEMRRWEPALRAAALAISRELGYQGDSGDNRVSPRRPEQAERNILNGGDPRGLRAAMGSEDAPVGGARVRGAGADPDRDAGQPGRDAL